MGEVPVIDVEALLERLEREPRPILVEALAARAFAAGHLPGALNLPRSRVGELAPRLLPDKRAAIVVYCRGDT